MTIEERLAALERRLQVAEDQLAITQLVYSYGPAVDTGSADASAELFTADAVYDVDTGIMRGHDEIGAMVSGAEHQSIIASGAGHVMAAPQIRLDGDQATVVSYSMLVLRRSAGTFVVARLTANRWELARVDGRWKISHRTARLVDDSGEGRTVLQTLTGPDTPTAPVSSRV